MVILMKDKSKIIKKMDGEHITIQMDKNIKDHLSKIKFMVMVVIIFYQVLNMKVIGVTD